MIITISGKSGSGKSTLSEMLRKDLTDAIHLDIDELNGDLMKTKPVIAMAKEIFGDNAIKDGKLDKQYILDTISTDKIKYTQWTDYMKDACYNFVKQFVDKTTFAYYIIDHLNAGIWDFGKDAVNINCIADLGLRLDRLQKRENISKECLDFRDKNHIETDADINYTQDNYSEVLDYIVARINNK